MFAHLEEILYDFFSVASIPEIEELWHEMLLIPSTLEQLMQTRTPNRF